MKKLLLFAVALFAPALTAIGQVYTVTPNSSVYSAAGGQITFTVNLAYPAGAAAVSFSAKPPGAAWVHVSTQGTSVPQVSPKARTDTPAYNGDTTDPLDPNSKWGWTYQDVPAGGSASFTFTVEYPANLTGAQVIAFAGDYRLNNVATTVTVTAVTLNSPPEFTAHPENVTALSGGNASFTAAARGGPTPTLKWQRSTDGGSVWNDLSDGAPFSGVTTGTLTVTGVTLALNGHRFRAVATSAGFPAVNSNSATLTVTQPAQIVGNPQPQVVQTGGTATFTVGATGSGTLTYKWYFTAAGSPTPTLIAGATSATLTISNVQTANVGDYVAVVNNGVGGDATSTAAPLSIAARIVRVVSQSAAPGANVVVPVQLLAAGNENALGFSVTFNAAQLTFVSAAVGAQAADATLNSNVSQAGAGSVGILLGKPTGTVWSAGTQEVIKLTFTLGASVPNGTVILLGFSDSPITREVVSSTVDVLAAGYSGGAVTAASGYEADMNGSNTLTASDWVRVGRIVAGLDPRPTGTDFLKADCSPRLNADGSLRRGNGSLTAADWVQAGRYAAGLDPLTEVGGPADATPAP